ncbi:hypothetical protein [Azospirillum doebereinerae]
MPHRDQYANHAKGLCHRFYAIDCTVVAKVAFPMPMPIPMIDEPQGASGAKNEAYFTQIAPCRRRRGIERKSGVTFSRQFSVTIWKENRHHSCCVAATTR